MQSRRRSRGRGLITLCVSMVVCASLLTVTTGGSIAEAARIVRESGAREILLACSHGVFAGPAVERLNKCPATKILVTDTIPARAVVPERLEYVTVAALFANAIRNIHESKSVSSLFD